MYVLSKRGTFQPFSNLCHHFFQRGSEFNTLNTTQPFAMQHSDTSLSGKKNINTLARVRMNWKICHPQTSKFASACILLPSAFRHWGAKSLFWQICQSSRAYFPTHPPSRQCIITMFHLYPFTHIIHRSKWSALSWIVCLIADQAIFIIIGNEVWARECRLQPNLRTWQVSSRLCLGWLAVKIILQLFRGSIFQMSLSLLINHVLVDLLH